MRGSTNTWVNSSRREVNPIQGGSRADDSAISQSFQVGLEWYQKQMSNPHNEAPCRKKMCKNFEKWTSNRNFCPPYKNSETSQQKSR